MKPSTERSHTMEQNRIIRLSTKVFAIVFAVLYAAVNVSQFAQLAHL